MNISKINNGVIIVESVPKQFATKNGFILKPSNLVSKSYTWRRESKSAKQYQVYVKSVSHNTKNRTFSDKQFCYCVVNIITSASTTTTWLTKIYRSY